MANLSQESVERVQRASAALSAAHVALVDAERARDSAVDTDDRRNRGRALAAAHEVADAALAELQEAVGELGGVAKKKAPKGEADGGK